jgi:hypothetical protein
VVHEETEGDKVALPLSLGEMDALLLRVGEGLGVTDTVAQSDDDSLALTLGECELLSVMEEEPLPDAQHVSVELTDKEAEDERLRKDAEGTRRGQGPAALTTSSPPGRPVGG